jgi:hypothetical protein
MLKILGLVIGIVVMVFGAAAPNTFAQYEGWKTYYNPNLKFSIDYPSYSGPDDAPTNITETTDEVHFKLHLLGVTIKAYPDSIKALEESAVSLQQTVLENWQDAILEQGVETVLYNGELGYRFVVFTPSDHLSTELTYFHSPNIEYDQYNVQFIGVKTVGFLVMVDEIMNTIRFFN